MGIVIRLSKEERDFTPKSQTIEHWEGRIAKAEKELEETPLTKPEDRTKKEKEIKALKEALENCKFLLEKFDGPTTFRVKSLTKQEVRVSMPKDLQKRFINVNDEDGVSVGTLEYSRDYSAHVCKLGVLSWSNLRNQDDNYAIVPFSRNLIECLPDDILTELANEITGVVDIDQVKSFK